MSDAIPTECPECHNTGWKVYPFVCGVNRKLVGRCSCPLASRAGKHPPGLLGCGFYVSADTVFPKVAADAPVTAPLPRASKPSPASLGKIELVIDRFFYNGVEICFDTTPGIPLAYEGLASAVSRSPQKWRRIFSDGGMVGTNPSEKGCTWSYIMAGLDDTPYHAACGWVTAAQAGTVLRDRVAVSNNYAELVAALFALESLPNDWHGELLTDSLVTLRRVETPSTAGMQGVPDVIRDRLISVRKRLGRVTVSLLGGHPSRDDLARGHRITSGARGLPVHRHNVACDEMCREMASVARAHVGRLARQDA